MSKQHIGSHSNHAQPDGKMSPRREYGTTSRMRRIMQHVANRKRRQRDKKISDEV